MLKCLILKNHTGTVSDLTGNFKLHNLILTDTLIISYVGFERQKISVDSLLNSQKIWMKEKTNLLNQVNVLPDNSVLINLINNCSKNQKTTTKTAKSYMMLESKSNNEPIEMLEAYYNGTYSNQNVVELDMKAGRVGVSPIRDHFMLSTETSKAVLKHELYESSSYFPLNPFNLSKKDLYKSYDLFLTKKYNDELNHPIFVIRFKPKKNSSDYFAGDVWIDSLENQVLQIKMSTKNTTKHPFLPAGRTEKISNVDLEINKSFEKIDGEMFLSQVDFNYRFMLTSSTGTSYNMHTRVFMEAFNFQEIYDIPFFEFTENSHQDYMKINAYPINSFFWENRNEFQLEDYHQKAADFIEKNAEITNESLFQSHQFNTNGFLIFDYVKWGKKRIGLTKIKSQKENVDPDVVHHHVNANTKLGTSMYNLNFQILLDINESTDSIHILTSSIIDPFSSFFNFPLDNKSLAFMNMYFDLVEIERRKLHSTLIKESNRESVITTYQSGIKNLEKISSEFFRDTQHGTDKKGMTKWNTLINSEIGIDNLDVFHVVFE